MINRIDEIYVKLMNEDVEVWRPIKAKYIKENIYQIVEQPYDIEIEKWEFSPGATVVCEYVNTAERKILAAIKKA